MWLCKYDLSKECEGKYKNCVDCVLDKIRAEIEEHVKINQHLNTDRARALCWCLDVIDKYKVESENEESDKG